MGKLVYSLISSAYFVDEKWGFGSPHQGILEIGRIAHVPRKKGKKKISFPVTWLVSPKSAIIEKELLTEFHEKYGDVVGYMLTYQDHSIKRQAELLEPENKDLLKKHVIDEIKSIKNVLPWAEISILGTGYRSNSLVQIMEELNLLGLWGNCVFQIGTDGITDFGAPWGQWYVNPDNFKKPKKYFGKVISLEWTVRDLNKAFHYALPEAFSTDPNDVEALLKCTNKNIEYWKALLGQYIENTACNDLVFFHQHQEAHEMEASPVCIPFTEQRVKFTSQMLKLFLDYVAKLDNVIITNANESLKIFNDINKGNQPPVFMYFKDIPIHELSPEFKKEVNKKPLNPKHVWLSFNEGFYNYINNFVENNPDWHLKTPPWEHSFFYYDADCMLIFDKPQNNPVWICNYTNEENRTWNDEYLLSESFIPLPIIDEALLEDDDSSLQIKVNIKSDKDMPYGIALWGDYSEFKIVNMSTLITSKIIADKLLFIKFNIKKGENILEFLLKHQSR
ncbi:MAG: hypothetical protein ACTSYS_08480 [Promethearchaeota archaeon]